MKPDVRKWIIRLIAALLVLGMLIPMIAGAEQTPKFGTLLTFQQEQETRWPSVSPGIREIPRYFQTDYYHINYNRGTIASNGCGVVSLAMVATYLLDRVYTPEQLVERYSYLKGTNVDRYNAMSEDLGLPYVRLATKWSHVIAALEQGQVVVLLLNSQSVLTTGQHFVVLTGITEDGRILLNDPFEPNYTHWQLSSSFAAGFDQNDLAPGFDGAWIYEKQPRNAEFDRIVLETYTGLWGQNDILDLWFAAG